MLRKKFLKGKKSTATEVSLVHLIEIIVGVMIVFALMYLSLKLSGFFIGRQEYDSAINNMEALAARVNELVKERKPIITMTTVYSISDNYILVGFSHENKGIMRSECTQETISKPRICQSRSCLCIYQNFGGIANIKGKDFDSKPSTPLKCKPFDGKVVFLAPQNTNFKGSHTDWNPAHYPGSYNYLVLYGRCGAPWRASWGIRQIYIEKYSDAENNYIFIGDLADERVLKRKEEVGSGKYIAAEKIFYRDRYWDTEEYQKRLFEEEKIIEEFNKKREQLAEEEKSSIERVWQAK